MKPEREMTLVDLDEVQVPPPTGLEDLRKHLNKRMDNTDRVLSEYFQTSTYVWVVLDIFKVFLIKCTYVYTISSRLQSSLITIVEFD